MSVWQRSRRLTVGEQQQRHERKAESAGFWDFKFVISYDRIPFRATYKLLITVWPLDSELSGQATNQATNRATNQAGSESGRRHQKRTLTNDRVQEAER